MTVWNQAGMHWRNYRVPKERKMHGPVGVKLPGDEGGERAHRSWKMLTSVYFAPGECSTCSECGLHVCAKIPGKCVPAAPPVLRSGRVELVQKQAGDFEWACARMLEGKTVQASVSATKRYALRFRNEPVGLAYSYALVTGGEFGRWHESGETLEAWIGRTVENGADGYSKERFELVEHPVADANGSPA